MEKAAANGKREAPRDKTLDERFWEIIPKQYDKTLVMEFLELAAKNNKVEPKDAMANAILNPESFIKFLASWYKKIKPKPKEPEILPPEEPAFVGPPEPPPKQEKPEQYLNCPEGGMIAMVDCADCPKKPCEAWE